jgi:hypothetical protein
LLRPEFSVTQDQRRILQIVRRGIVYGNPRDTAQVAISQKLFRLQLPLTDTVSACPRKWNCPNHASTNIRGEKFAECVDWVMQSPVTRDYDVRLRKISQDRFEAWEMHEVTGSHFFVVRPWSMRVQHPIEVEKYDHQTTSRAYLLPRANATPAAAWFNRVRIRLQTEISET